MVSALSNSTGKPDVAVAASTKVLFVPYTCATGCVKLIVWLVAVTVNVRSTGSGAKKLALSACEALIFATPPLLIVTVLPATVATLVFKLLNTTGKPELAVAARVKVLFSPNTWLLNALKVMMLVALATVTVCVAPAAP